MLKDKASYVCPDIGNSFKILFSGDICKYWTKAKIVIFLEKLLKNEMTNFFWGVICEERAGDEFANALC